ncbi:MAG TPA: bifunctional glutamate N-acetyltransferase/amino-acid acetyltransferase ArgJ [Ktedonobacterales bacterium]|nr:bifunctional glutamate N-acetyltransferase/amino-acid acetyltransferase ArgJ [Ktedonobacterales bacterium]
MSTTFHTIQGAVTAAPGFRAGSIAAGVKAEAGTRDVAMLVSERLCTVAGTFTTSRAPAAPVLLCKEHLLATGGRAQAVVMNSGNANCSNGERGMIDARRMAELAGQRLGIDPQYVMVSSTGIIGRPLPMEKIERGIADVQLVPDGGHLFTLGIMTTDTRAKEIAIEFELEGKKVRLGGSTKGAGMIYPNMATMLCYLTTDVALDPTFQQDVLRRAVNDSYNMICIDGDMSTNDTVLLFANGLAGNTPLTADAPGASVFEAALRHVTRYLAREMARDGEGATKLMEVVVQGARTDADARRAARALTISPIWRCAVYGEDANWGRVLSTLGACGAEMEHDRLDVSFGDVLVVHNGVATDFRPEAAKAVLAQAEFTLNVDLHLGFYSATAWGCDMTHGYIDENATYHR